MGRHKLGPPSGRTNNGTLTVSFQLLVFVLWISMVLFNVGLYYITKFVAISVLVISSLLLYEAHEYYNF